LLKIDDEYHYQYLSRMKNYIKNIQLSFRQKKTCFQSNNDDCNQIEGISKVWKYVKILFNSLSRSSNEFDKFKNVSNVSFDAKI